MGKIIFTLICAMAALGFSTTTTYAAATPETQYTQVRVNFRAAASLDSEVKEVLEPNTEVKVYKEGKFFCRVTVDGERGYIAKQYLDVEKVDESYYDGATFRTLGVIQYCGSWWTWYSARVLPGGGLDIPGRHIDAEGYICDEDEYICLASGSLAKGTVVNTPLSKQGKVYDYCITPGVIDVYCYW